MGLPEKKRFNLSRFLGKKSSGDHQLHDPTSKFIKLLLWSGHTIDGESRKTRFGPMFFWTKNFFFKIFLSIALLENGVKMRVMKKSQLSVSY